MTITDLKASTALRPDPGAVETWIFDLDNTLYPASSTISPQVSERMTEFVRRTLGVEPEEAARIRRALFLEYGTTLRGMMTVHGIEAAAYLDFVHDVDASGLVPPAALAAAIAALPGRKLIHTNASTRHAERILERLGIASQFSGIFDIVDAEFLPKPDPAGYDALIRQHGFRPERAAMIEDMARNLKPAAERGMATLWVRTDHDWAIEGQAEPWVHHRTDDLAGWLAQWGSSEQGGMRSALVDSGAAAADRAALDSDGKTP